MSVIHWINLMTVGIFGMILSASFCDIFWTRKRMMIMMGSMAAVLACQGLIYFGINQNIVEYVYPLITHLPLVLVLCFLKKKLLWPVVSVLVAYLCCQMRRWLALLITAVLSGGLLMQDTIELALTLPILVFLLWFAAPKVRVVSHHTVSVQWQFGLVPALYYGFDYLTRVYTNLILEGGLVVAEFMPFVCSIAYLLFAVHISEEERVRSGFKQTQENLNQQIEQAVREIGALRESQEKTRIYRHDLRHHMQYLFSCIDSGRLEQAKDYIHEVCSEMETKTVSVFCENEAANLIFSSFNGRAEKGHIPMKVRAEISHDIAISESDLCVLLSNALENALHACEKRKENGLVGEIEVSAYEKKGKFFLQIMNSCDAAEILFKDGVPVTDRRGHGIGVRSICAIVDKYNGIYSFSAKDDGFILRASL